MSSSSDLRQYVDEDGNFELPAYLYKLIINLMKSSLDLGTLLSTDPVRLRAYKERVKASHKEGWYELAQVMEAFEMTEPCGCTTEYCKVCGGARYRLNRALSPDEMQEIAVVTGDEDSKTAQQLREGLERALRETERYR